MDGGIIKGYASTWADVDQVGDICRRGCFADSIKEIKRTGRALPLLFSHKNGEINYFIGKVTELEEDAHGLKFKAELDDTPEAIRARQLVKDRRIWGCSFAYNVLDQGKILKNGRTANELRKLQILEISICLNPCNRATHCEVELTRKEALKAAEETLKAAQDLLEDLAWKEYLEKRALNEAMKKAKRLLAR